MIIIIIAKMMIIIVDIIVIVYNYHSCVNAILSLLLFLL